uniref:Uncharacterized protein n=1 Tax=viral metagenome TaxID=1070528 RepID=A0A6C0IU01_9ZZZZ
MSNTTIKNVSLYIKRAEESHNEEYIKNAFAKTFHGDVKSTKFIPKEDQYGTKYNGVIVHFDKWYSSNQVKKLFEDLAKSSDGICRLYHDTNNNRYWNVMEYTDINNLSEILICDELTNIQSLYKNKDNENNKDNEYINQLEKLVSSMACQMNYLQKQILESEQKINHANIANTQLCLRNGDLLCQMTEKDIEVAKAKQECFKVTLENAMLKSRLENADQEINDMNNILHYVDNECLEMKTMMLQSKMESELRI